MTATEAHIFVAFASPWRAAMVSLDGRTGNDLPAIVAWADGAATALKGSPAELASTDGSWGDLGLRRMLDPWWIRTLSDLEGGTVVVESECHGQLVDVAPEMVSLGAVRYEADYDDDKNVILEWRALIDGRVAQRTTLSSLTAIV